MGGDGGLGGSVYLKAVEGMNNPPRTFASRATYRAPRTAEGREAGNRTARPRGGRLPTAHPIFGTVVGAGWPKRGEQLGDLTVEGLRPCWWPKAGKGGWANTRFKS